MAFLIAQAAPRLHSRRGRAHWLAGFLCVYVALSAVQCSHAEPVPARRLLSSDKKFPNPAENGGKKSCTVGQEFLFPLSDNYRKLSAELWQFAHLTPRPNNFLQDSTGANALYNQLRGGSNVLFLGGIFDNGLGLPKTITRTITIPKGTKLYFPVFDFLNTHFPSIGDPPLGATLESMVAEFAPLNLGQCFNDPQNSLQLEIDGHPVDIRCNYVVSRQFGPLSLPEDHIWDAPGGPLEGPQTTADILEVGWSAFVRPLDPGHHTIRIKVDCTAVGAVFDVTYDITVTP